MPTRTDGAAAARKIEQFARGVPQVIEGLRQAVVARGRPDWLPLDLSMASLDRAEDFYRAVLEEKPGDRAAAEQARAGLEAYVGATLIERVGARWDYSHEKETWGAPCVLGIPSVPSYPFFPGAAVAGFRITRAPGAIRDATEIYDLAERDRETRRQLARIDDEIAALGAEVRELLGLLGPEAGELDFSVASADVVEQALRRVYAANGGREQRRRLRNRAALYLGRALERAVGQGEWVLATEPRSSSFGQLEIHGWSPYATVKCVNRKAPEGLLAENLRHQIESLTDLKGQARRKR